MKTTIAALFLAASTAASALPTAAEKGVVVQGGLHFQKTIVLQDAAFCDGSVRLEKGTYDVRFESRQGNKVHVEFFQGGVRKGEANGIVIVNSVPADKTRKGSPASFEDLGLRPSSAHAFQKQGGKLNLVIGDQSSNAILIGLLLPAVQRSFGDGSVHPGGVNLPSEQKVQPVGK